MNKVVVALAILVALSGCSNKEQEEATARQEQRERREAEELKRINERRASEQAAREEAEAQPEEPAAPPEPQYEEKELYKYDNTECESYENTACGVNFARCSNGMIYECMHNVKYTTITKKVLVE